MSCPDDVIKAGNAPDVHDVVQRRAAALLSEQWHIRVGPMFEQTFHRSSRPCKDGRVNWLIKLGPPARRTRWANQCVVSAQSREAFLQAMACDVESTFAVLLAKPINVGFRVLQEPL